MLEIYELAKFNKIALHQFFQLLSIELPPIASHQIHVLHKLLHHFPHLLVFQLVLADNYFSLHAVHLLLLRLSKLNLLGFVEVIQQIRRNVKRGLFGVLLRRNCHPLLLEEESPAVEVELVDIHAGYDLQQLESGEQDVILLVFGPQFFGD